MSTQQERWQRLHDIALERSVQLGYRRQDDIPNVSSAWLRGLKKRAEPATSRQAIALDALDEALRWDRGTSLRLSQDDFEPGSDTDIDERDRLVQGSLIADSTLTQAEQLDLLAFETLVLARLRDMPHGQRQAAMTKIGEWLEINPNGR